MRPIYKRNHNGPKEHGVIGIKGYKKHYDLPVTTKNLESLYKTRPAQEAGSVTLIIRRLGYDNPVGHAYQVESYEDFASKPFDELWDYLSTPKWLYDNWFIRIARSNK
jgi:hypothetical protein